MKNFKDLSLLINNEIEETLNEFHNKDLFLPIKYCLKNGGKRIRPLLCLMANELLGGNPEKILDAAIAIEIFHNFTLLHDDIMDNSDLRRGFETVHKKWNNNVAILSGDAMSIIAYQKLAKSEGFNNEILNTFSEAALQVCEGQQMDMDFEKTLDVSLDDYIEMIRLKTAVLLATSLKIGACYANADKNTLENIYDLGINLGLAFQIQDDYLDSFADKEKFKKNLGGDIVENKKTFLLIKSLELADKNSKEELISWINKTDFNKDEKISAVKKIYEKLNIDIITKNTVDSYFEKAEINFNNINVPQENKEMLSEFILFLKERNY